ncbi:MAG TPA: hypothetical protein VEC96_05700 [Anaerolineae bacterium]|nr:hypothetical protein [Anaerolineae bacterium]
MLFVSLGSCNNASLQPTPAYGTKVRYALNQPLTFPDLTLEFIGERWVDASPNYPRGFTYYDFKVGHGDQEQIISWSAGTGDIGPAPFEVAGQDYWLELVSSDRLGRLEKDELVLWKE